MNNPKISFFYIEKYREDEYDKILCGKFENKLYPANYQKTNSKDMVKFFIYGKGTIERKKPIWVDRLKGETCNDLTNYIREYGENILFYSLTNTTLEDQDCVMHAARQEFKSALWTCGFDYLFEFNDEVKKLNQMIENHYKKLYGANVLLKYSTKINDERNDFQYIFKDKLFFVKPHFSVMAYVIVAPYIDPVSDDDKLWKHWVNVKRNDQSDDEFPVSVKDRLTFLLGKDISTEYERIMNKYPLSFNKNVSKGNE